MSEAIATTEAAPAMDTASAMDTAPAVTEAAPSLIDGGAIGLTTTPGIEPAVVIEGREWIPEEFRSEGCLKPVPDVQTLVKNYVNAQKQIGMDKVILPSKHATEDDWAAFYQKIGHPSALEEYHLDLPKEMEFQDGFITQFKEFAFKNNMMPDQAQKFLEWYHGKNEEALSEQEGIHEAELEQKLAGLKQEWGVKYQQNLNAAKALVTEVGDDQVFNWLEQSGLSNSPEMIKFLSKVGQMFFKEDQVVGQQTGSLMTPNEAQGQIDAIKGDKAHPYWDRGHPNHDKATKEVRALYQMAFPAE